MAIHQYPHRPFPPWHGNAYKPSYFVSLFTHMQTLLHILYGAVFFGLFVPLCH